MGEKKKIRLPDYPNTMKDKERWLKEKERKSYENTSKD